MRKGTKALIALTLSVGLIGFVAWLGHAHLGGMSAAHAAETQEPEGNAHGDHDDRKGFSMSAFSRRQFVGLMGAAGTYAATYPLIGRLGPTPAAAMPAYSSDTPGFETAIELARRIRDKEISSLELTDYFIDRIDRGRSIRPECRLCGVRRGEYSR